MSLHPKRLSLADHERTPFTPPYIITLLKLSKVSPVTGSTNSPTSIQQTAARRLSIRSSMYSCSTVSRLSAAWSAVLSSTGSENDLCSSTVTLYHYTKMTCLAPLSTFALTPNTHWHSRSDPNIVQLRSFLCGARVMR